MAIPPAVIVAGKAIVTALAPEVFSGAKKYWNTDHGSKVIRGEFNDCSIEMFGDKSCIVVDEKSGKVVMLTSDTIKSYKYAMEKKRRVGLHEHTYFYYDIIFKDGTESYVRMRRVYSDALKRHAKNCAHG